MDTTKKPRSDAYKMSTIVRLRPHVEEALRAVASAEDRSLNNTIEQAILLYAYERIQFQPSEKGTTTTQASA